jgi:hypothetical protein
MGERSTESLPVLVGGGQVSEHEEDHLEAKKPTKRASQPLAPSVTCMEDFEITSKLGISAGLTCRRWRVQQRVQS